ncbi:MAG: DUF885 domain-containing protein [Chloroflexi bacterium]|nr:DUF885 domain-containing protein [Chloroflexota bacterium]
MTVVTDQILADYWRMHPVEGTHAGVHDFDSVAPDLSPNGLDERRAWREGARSMLESTVEEDLDHRVLLAEMVRLTIVDDEWQWPRRAPQLHLEQALNGLQYLLARPPAASASEAILARVDAIPRLLLEARRNLRGDLVPPEFVEIALVGSAGAQRFLAELPVATESARQAVADFEQFLQVDLEARGSFALGRDAFERLLHEVHAVPLSADEVFDHGRELAQQLLAQLGPSWRSEVESLKREHPTREALLETYATEALRAREFVERRGLVEIPPGESFEVRPTAPFLRATMPLGHFDRTPPFSPSDNLGVLYITPVDPQLSDARQAELLEAHCFTAVRAICLHETFPGHHVQLWHAKLRGTPVRRQFPSPLFTEGWALYCEELMEEAGYYDSPALRVWRLKNALWRAVRLMVDVGLHCRGLRLEDAAQPLIELGGLEPNTARGEALRYTSSPTQPGSYMLGRDRIVELRRLAERRPGFVLAEFHRKLLGFSSISPALIPESEF